MEDLDLLSDKELEDAIWDAVRAKRASINREKYYKEITKERPKIELNTAKMKAFFVEQYNKSFGTFQETEHNCGVFNALCAYFSKDEKVCKSLGIELNKGIFLYGGLGCGKTSMMRNFSQVLTILQQDDYPAFGFVDCAKLQREYSTNGYESVMMYTKPANIKGSQNCGWCYDDLGDEGDGKHYGKNVNTMAEILQMVYSDHNMKSRVHITSNLDGEGIEENYGNRLRSRMREMFNMVTFPADSPDMRK